MLLFPAAASAEWLAGWLGLSIFVQIPLSMAFLAPLCFAAIGIRPSLGFSVLFLTLLLPLGFYWWVAQSGPLVVSLLRFFRAVPIRPTP